jgi:hypothetical protein
MNPPIDVIAEKMNRRHEAVMMKCRPLGLEVVVNNCSVATTTSIHLPKELPSIEEALGILTGALKAATEAGLNKVEVQQLQVIATLARTYKDILADYVNYSAIERKVVELEAKYAKLSEKAKNPAAQSDLAPMVPPAA